MNGLTTEKIAVLGSIPPAAQGAGTVSTGWVDHSEFEQLTALLSLGAITASGTVDAKLEQATSAAGAGAKDVTGKAVAQMVDATDDDKQALINMRSEDLDAANSFTHVRLTVTVTEGCVLGATLLGSDARYKPASDSNAASVAQVVQ